MFGFGKKKSPEQAKPKSVCQYCGLDCGDKMSLERHLDWAHKDQKPPVKS